MVANEWEKVKQTFERALTLSEAERLAYVEAACAGAGEIRRTVLELLAAHTAAGSFMDHPWIPPPANPVFAPGQLVAGRFRIVRQLSRGGMGEVYEAYDEKLRLTIALKTLRPELTADKEALPRFEREIRMARQVTHHSLCRVYDLIEHRCEDDPNRVITCLSMQFIAGESLHAHLERHRPLSPKDALPLIAQIAEALEVLHDNGIVHRDLKPSNIMLVPAARSGLRIIVTDFGLAKPLDSPAEQFETQLGFRAGSPYFMAPELLRGGPPSVRTDLYAFGLLIDEMVTRTRAFPVVRTEELLYQRLREDPVPPSARTTDLPASWDRAILRCLAPDPQDRYLRVRDVISELEDVTTATVLPADGAETSGRGKIWASLNDTFRDFAARRSPIYAALALTVITAILAFGAYVTRPLDTSVVVFPLENLTSEPEHNYLCKGTSLELSNRLARISGLRVIPYYEPRSTLTRPPAQGAFSVSGYLQKSAKGVRIALQLTDNRDGALVWTDHFQHDLNNQLQLQFDIAERTVQAIEGRILFDDNGIRSAGIIAPLRRVLGLQRGLSRSPTNSSVALDLYMRGRYLWDARTTAATLDAIQLFNRAIDEDPNFALAWAALSEAQFVLMDYSYAPTAELMGKAREYAQRAVTVDPELADGYVALAAGYQMDWDWARAESNYLKAISANPRHARARRWYAGLLVQFRRFDEAIEQTRQAIKIDPYEYGHRAGLGLYLYYAGRYAQAAAELEHVLSEKDVLAAHISLGHVYAVLGKRASGTESAMWFDKALHEAGIVQQRESAQEPTYSGPMHALIYALRGDRAAAQQYLHRLFPAMSAGHISPVAMAQAYAALGDDSTALSLLESALQSRDRHLLYIHVSPFFSHLNQSNRFQSLIAAMHL